MEFKAGFAIAVAVTTISIVIDWPRALTGLAFARSASICRIARSLLPVGSVIISTVGEVLYLDIDVRRRIALVR